MLAKFTEKFAPGSRTIVTGNTPASRQLRREFDSARQAEGHQLWDSPDILPRDAWLRRAWQECAWSEPAATPVLLTRWQELTLWEEAVESATRDVLLNSHATATAAREAWHLLHAWEAPLDKSLFDSEDTGAFFDWMSRVRRQLLDRGGITTAELPGALAEQPAPGAVNISGAITLSGFGEITPADRRLFDALGAREATTPDRGANQVARAVCHDVSDELTQAAVWARQKLQASPDARIGIVVPGLSSIATIADRIFDDVLHPAWGFTEGQRAFDISGGRCLADVPTIATALLALRLIEGVPREEAATLWRSPFIRIDADEGARLDVELRRQKIEAASSRVDSVKRRFPEFAAAAATLPARSRPSQWSAAFSRLLRLAGWPGRRSLSSEETRTLESWKDLLSELARLDTVVDLISSGSAISRLQRMAAGSPFSVDGDNAQVQILDMEEAGGTRFDALWMAGLHAGAWPRRAQSNPFLPLVLQRAAGMPRSSAAREIAHAKRVTENLLASAPEVVCSFPAHAADEEQRPSPFLANLPLLPDLPRADTALRRVFSQAAPLEPRPADEHVPLAAGTLQRGGTKVLADQSACPFRAFAIHRLRAREMDEPDVGFSAMERGSVVHRALELLWKDLRTQERLKTVLPTALESLVRSCVDEALAQYAAKQEPSRALNEFCELERARLETLIRQWLDIEIERPNFAVILSEDARTIEIAGLKLDIRVDRIDRYDDGTHAIVDYKASKDVSTNMWQGERPEAPQLPLYAMKCELPVSEVAFAQVTSTSVKWEGLCGNDFKKLRPEWDATVHRLAQDFLNGRAEVDPRKTPSPCDLCKLRALCRLTELRKRTAEDGNE